MFKYTGTNIAITILGILAVTSARKLSDGECRSQVASNGIGIWSANKCSNRNVRGCTSLEQIRDVTCKCIVVLKKASKCPILITGGTEVGHGTFPHSHWNGYKLDISLNSCINNYIKQSFKYTGKRPADGALLYKSASGNIYARESNHWDITYYNC